MKNIVLYINDMRSRQFLEPGVVVGAGVQVKCVVLGELVGWVVEARGQTPWEMLPGNSGHLAGNTTQDDTGTRILITYEYFRSINYGH